MHKTNWITGGLLVLALGFIQDEPLLSSKLKIVPGTTPAETAGRVAESFVNTPYVAHTLEQPGEERLVINLHQLDCTTFVENVVALTHTIESDTLTAEQFEKKLSGCRYKDGIINGYASRQHYFSSFLNQLKKENKVMLMAKEWGGVPYDKPITFMSTHRTLYKSLADDTAFEQVREAEKELGQIPSYYIPKNTIQRIESKMNTGDIIGITSTKAGLDVSHEGFAYRKNGRIHLLHASTDQKKVVISSEPLADYLAKHRDQSGIIVARLQ